MSNDIYTKPSHRKCRFAKTFIRKIILALEKYKNYCIKSEVKVNNLVN